MKNLHRCPVLKLATSTTFLHWCWDPTCSFIWKSATINPIKRQAAFSNSISNLVLNKCGTVRVPTLMYSMVQATWLNVKFHQISEAFATNTLYQDISTPKSMERYESFPQFVKPIQNIRVSPFLMSKDIQRQNRHIVFETVTTPCQTPKTNQNLRTVTHTHIQTTPRTTPFPTAPQNES